MGGKTWQMEEEEFFWRVVVPQSPEGIELSQRRYSWKQCADLMQQKLGHRGLRNYSKQLLYEHFYQNCKSERPSPRARGFVREYLSKRVPLQRQHPNSSSRAKWTAAPRSGTTPSSGTPSPNPRDFAGEGQRCQPSITSVDSSDEGKRSAERDPLPTNARPT